MRRRIVTVLLPLLLGAVALRVGWPTTAKAQAEEHSKSQSVPVASQHNDAVSAAAFEAIIPVLRHPRCMNCHSTGDYPRQGDDSHPHTMQVRRGPNGFGANVVECSTCHQGHNLSGVHTPPGAPDWRMPAPDMPMIWEGLSDRQLCDLFKDPNRNGGRDVEGIVEHLNTPLVLWGWNPGPGRTPVPMPQQQFLATIQEWASNGAACPAETHSPSAAPIQHDDHSPSLR